tara:strand:- start:3370 stop:3840 length:471 start_codon:yes stop_codon:yes gene_type:complete
MKLYFYKLTTFTLLLFFQSSAAASEFKLYLDDSRTEFIMVEKQDCSVYKSENGKITLGFKAGGLFFGIGPEVTFGKESGIDWDKLTQRLVARYLELCTRFNTGSISKSEYDKRLKKIEAIETAAYKLYQKLVEEEAKRKDRIFEELDEATKQTSSK